MPRYIVWWHQYSTFSTGKVTFKLLQAEWKINYKTVSDSDNCCYNLLILNIRVGRTTLHATVFFNSTQLPVSVLRGAASRWPVKSATQGKEHLLYLFLDNINTQITNINNCLLWCYSQCWACKLVTNLSRKVLFRNAIPISSSIVEIATFCNGLQCDGRKSDKRYKQCYNNTNHHLWF
jgi:hypothetical protein